MLISSTAQHSTRAIVLTSDSVECRDHDFSSEKITPSATLPMNLTETLGYVFCEGEYGNGRIYVSVNDATMDCSTIIKHVTNLYLIMRYGLEMATLVLIAGGGRTTPYFVIVDCGGGPEHNLEHLTNQIYMFALSLVRNMDKLVATCGCPGLSYLNNSGRAMVISNIGLSGLGLSIDPRTEEWLLSKVLKGAMYM